METNSINSFLVLITGDIDNFMYTYILVALLVFTGIYFTIRTKGVQFRYIKDMFTQLFEKKVDKNGKAISSFQAMMVSTGSRVGTGNIAGIATALAMGGPGALFWMWVMALIGGASAFIESTLAPDLQDSRQRWAIPWWTCLLHPTRFGQTLDGHRVRGLAHCLLCGGFQ